MRGRPEDFEFRWINGRKHFRTNKGTWQDCTNPPSQPCKFCGNRHWVFQSSEFGCRSGGPADPEVPWGGLLADSGT